MPASASSTQARTLGLFLLAILVAAPAFAGCLGPRDGASDSLTGGTWGNYVLDARGVTAKRFDSVLHEKGFIVSFDGTRLAVDVWRPETEEKVPVVAVISPYMGNEITGYRKDPNNDNYPAYGPYQFLVEELVPAGYAAALVDLRGTRQSDGCIDLGGPKEQKDADAIAEWLGTQAWSSGKVGFLGKSYDGLTAQEALVSGNPHVATIVVEAPVSGWYPVQKFGGVSYTGWNPQTPALYAAIDNTYVEGANPQEGDWLASYARQHECADAAPRASNPLGDKDDWFVAHDLYPHIDKARGSVFYVHGLLDVNARPDNAFPWYNALDVPKKGYFWQAPHEWPTYEHENAMEEWSGRTDFWLTVHRWFDYWLVGVPNGMDQELNVQVQDQLGRWRNETEFPPAHAQTTPFYLGAGKLTTEPVTAEAPLQFADDSGGRTLGPADPAQDALPRRLVFQSDPLPEAFHVSGLPTVALNVQSTAASTHFVARLFDVTPDGKWQLINHGALNIRHRAGVDQPQPYTPGTREAITIELQMMDYVLEPGHAIALVVQSSEPDIWIPAGTSAVNTVHVGGADASALNLPRVNPTRFFATTWGERQVLTLGEVLGMSPDSP